MRTFERNRDRSFVYRILFFALLAASIHGVKYVPFFRYPGLDFENLFVFHRNCPGWPIPYALSGTTCGDPLNRPMVYPPLAYWAMAWTRAFDFRVAYALWAVAIVGLTLLSMRVVTSLDGNRKRSSWGVAILLLFQMPMVYAVERGNIDVLVVASFVAGIFLLARGRAFLAGLVFAVACWTKVYPAIPSALILTSLAADPRERGTSFLGLFIGLSVGAVAGALLLLPDSYRYLTEVLPRFAGERGGFGVSSHTLYRGAASLFLKIPILIGWGYFLARLRKYDVLLAFTAALAISTFFQDLSNDYNLITAYPFLVLVAARLLRKAMGIADLGILVLTFLAFVGDRTPLETLFQNRGALVAQVIWFFVFPVFVMKKLHDASWAGGALDRPRATPV